MFRNGRFWKAFAGDQPSQRSPMRSMLVGRRSPLTLPEGYGRPSAGSFQEACTDKGLLACKFAFQPDWLERHWH